VTVGSVPLWEQPVLRQTAGETLRPGSFELTDRGADLLGFAPGWKILDVGSGLGASVNRLRSRYGVEAYGVEQSIRQLEQASDTSNLVQATGDSLPFAGGSFHAVLCECALSLFPNPGAGLAEFQRVTMPGGFLILSDLFADRAAPAEPGSCAGRAMPLASIRQQVECNGYEILRVEEHTVLLKDLAARLVLAGGGSEKECGCAGRKGLGYYLMIAVKGY